ncbi:hypothetical protein BDY19DRAFT_891473 [Irpex rosettiformis]|uniref:Uncharacterized protein n=1 Tax=Irpex rosettiformis TaxID=378272 RepID=A0ACB8U227_9APHY|nr:hypothetical protein BDY19DRAFT_891473 [Irpex rosettiformis]
MSSPASPSASPSSRPASPAPENTHSALEQDAGHAESSTPPSDAKADEKEESTESPDPQPSASPTLPSSTPGTASAGDWQAIWSPAHNAYYFFNSITQETTWSNPLEQGSTSTQASESATPEDGHTSSSPSAIAPGPSAAVSQLYAMQAAAAAQGIDPSLAFLDPTLAAGSSTSTNPAAYAYTAKFNARTGAFARPDARDPGHLSEYERMKRMNEVFFDQAQWEQQLAQEKEEEEGSRKRKKPTKKDLERFKEQKRQKKIAKTAWLRT